MEERMAKLIHSAIMSLDGYIEDADGKIDRTQPDERSTASPTTRCETCETVAVWETEPALAAASPVTDEESRRFWAANLKPADAFLFHQHLAEMAEGGSPC
jgi:hypothetical protein